MFHSSSPEFDRQEMILVKQFFWGRDICRFRDNRIDQFCLERRCLGGKNSGRPHKDDVRWLANEKS
jgi:hypothetical protein